MASINWKKMKSAEEVKALFRHDEREKREDTEFHRNFHIDKSKTHFNHSIIGRRYMDRCNMYDEAVESVEAVMASSVETYVPKSGKNAGKTMQRKKSKLRKDATTALNLYVPVPKDLPFSEYYRWFKAVHDIESEFFGEENVIDSDIHFDEVHEYFDTFLKEWIMSRVHMHTTIIPRTADGRLCCNDIFTRENCKKLNDLVEEMTQREFGIAFNTGETPRKETVEDLKSKSYAAELALFNELEAKIADSKKQLEDLNTKISDCEEHLEQLNTEISKLEEYKKKVNAEISDGEEYLDALKAEVPNSLERRDELDAEIYIQRAYLEDLNIKLSIKEQYLNETNGEIYERKKSKKRLDDEIANRESRKKELDDELSEINLDIAAAKPVAEAAVKELYEWDEKIKERRQQLTEKNDELEKVTDKIIEKNEELSLLDTKIEQINKKIAKHFDTIKKGSNIIIKLKDDINELNNTYNYMQNQKKVDDMVRKANAIAQNTSSLESQYLEANSLVRD